jgi:hypothetical protein
MKRGVIEGMVNKWRRNIWEEAVMVSSS